MNAYQFHRSAKADRRAEYQANPFKNPRQRFSAYDRRKWRDCDRWRDSQRFGIPEKRTVRHINSIGGNYAFELVWGQARGSKLRAYRIARQFAARNNSQSITCPLATPKGFLP